MMVYIKGNFLIVCFVWKVNRKFASIRYVGHVIFLSVRVTKAANRSCVSEIKSV